MSIRGLKQIYEYGNENLSITDLLKNPEILNFLVKNKTYASKREKLRKLLREHGAGLRQRIDEYNLRNPPQPQQQEFRENASLYGAQRRRANLPKKDTKGNIFFGPEKPSQPSIRKRIGVVNINGENLTAKQAL